MLSLLLVSLEPAKSPLPGGSAAVWAGLRRAVGASSGQGAV